MEIQILVHTHDSYGGHCTPRYLRDFLLLGAPDFGGAIRTPEVHPTFRVERRPKRGNRAVAENPRTVATSATM